MRHSNFIQLTGNLGGPVEIKEIAGGGQVARLSVAETVWRKNAQTGAYEQAHTNWIPVTTFGRLAKRVAGSLRKGDRVSIVGSLKVSSFQKDGENRRSFEVIADSVELAQLLARSDASEAAEVPPFDEFKEETMGNDLAQWK